MNALDLRWIVPVLAILGVQYFVALLIGVQLDFSYEVPFRSFGVVGLNFAIIGFCLPVVWQLFRFWREGEQNPLRRILPRLPWALAVGFLLVACQFAVLNWAKVMMPAAVGFWADPAFADLDHLLFGQDPWRLSHQYLGQATPVIDKIYGFWAPVNFAILLFLFYLPPSPKRAQALIAYFLAWAGGTLGQYLGASAGPIFYESIQLGDRFAELPVSPWTATAREYLWTNYLKGGGLIGAGISAMPSMHVAIALWIALVGRTFLPRYQVIFWAYFATILVGSVHLGWHYAVDGIAASVIVPVVWVIAGTMATTTLNKQRQPEPSIET
ncbi:phosphatase PAP2 family protein [Pelagibius marinus]|uniref:phosphatase PAP2 family protein n=1 Tax=Pelagibius marinus TaxID=2762760 RepID=UPI001872EE6E|nr:phosphatase PAP2 family protein [Pelagibius marinus]